MSGFNHTAAHLAARAQLLTLSVVTTGSATLAATTTGYTRASGSFITDGFAVGMELAPTGFGSNPSSTIKSVTALAITVKDGRAAESASAGRTLAVGVPTIRGWENIEATPTTGAPYFTEEYVPGPQNRASLGAGGELEADPLYIVKIFVPSNVGRATASRYADAVLNLFPPSTDLSISAGQLFVRGNPAPFAGQLLQLASGWAVVPVTIPLRYRVQRA